jgi:hypothetical protein
MKWLQINCILVVEWEFRLGPEREIVPASMGLGWEDMEIHCGGEFS